MAVGTAPASGDEAASGLDFKEFLAQVECDFEAIKETRLSKKAQASKV